MKLSDFDQSITLAKNNEDTYISAVRWGKLWRFYVKHGAMVNGDQVGLPFDSKQAILNNAYNYILKESGFDFKESDLLEIVPKLTTVQLTQDQKVAINTAIMLLKQSNSDHADQALHHIVKITENF